MKKKMLQNQAQYTLMKTKYKNTNYLFTEKKESF